MRFAAAAEELRVAQHAELAHRERGGRPADALHGAGGDAVVAKTDAHGDVRTFDRRRRPDGRVRKRDGGELRPAEVHLDPEDQQTQDAGGGQCLRGATTSSGRSHDATSSQYPAQESIRGTTYVSDGPPATVRAWGLQLTRDDLGSTSEYTVKSA